MSRIGNRVLTIPENVTVSVDDQTVNVKGPKGELSTKIDRNITVSIEGNELKVERKNDKYKQFHGTANANINNMLIGVTEGFSKTLDMVGVGYRFTLKGNKLAIAAGFSHPMEMEIPAGLTVEVPTNTQVIIKGFDKYLVGEFAANVRKTRKPEPYKGKGIRYSDERVIRKVGKKAAK